jgi:hypothetical protein
VLHKDLRAALGPTANFYYRELPAEIRDELWRRVNEALAQLRASNKLGLVRFKFPP